MPYLFLLAALGVFLVCAVLWNVAMVVGLRFLRISLPFSLPFRFFSRKEADLLEALNGRSINAYVFISGLLLFACPLFAGLIAYDYVVRHFIKHSTYGLSDLAQSMSWFALFGIFGFWSSIRHWQRSAESGIGFTMLAILVLRVSIDTMGVLRACAFMIPAALFCLFAYIGIQSFRRASGASNYSRRSDYVATNNFITESFTPSEAYQAQQALARKLTASGFNSEQIERISVPDDLPDEHSPISP